uniref:CSON015059 protein n=1 Tax=Culicoides sonorensis TaxID=179676 RepID=A0A336LNI2_CULSO
MKFINSTRIPVRTPLMGKCVSKGTLTNHGNLRLNNHEDVLCHESEWDAISYIYNDNNNLSGAENDSEVGKNLNF